MSADHLRIAKSPGLWEDVLRWSACSKQHISLAKDFHARWRSGPWFQGPCFPTCLAEVELGDSPGVDVLGWSHLEVRVLPLQSMGPSLPF